MTPEDIRIVFETKYDRKGLVEWAIDIALMALEQLPPKQRPKSPYSLRRLTEGLPHQNEILAQALDQLREKEEVRKRW